ncbi:uncharacterized protein LOC113088631 [Carassius auratus]|uniref:Uncharacterized protein LOC113088630 n=1 Tax=Carassius auratus TaxID=7957 RepID=A0A6P6NST8_CARAU|nr:uncharacterized protein LOC113088630 [Carassius auratus]XP_026111571.1 uncharacterized protein LOC113088631 [Carassius auratus]
MGQTCEGSPNRDSAVYTSVYGARPVSVLSRGRPANPATLGASGRSGLQRVSGAVSPRRCVRLAPSEGGPRAVSSGGSCASASGPRTSCSNYTRGQPREAGSLSRMSDRMEKSAEYISMGPADSREGLQNPVRFSSPTLQRGVAHSSASRAGSGHGARSEISFSEKCYRAGVSSRQGIGFLQPLFHCSKKGWRAASHFRSSSVESYSSEIKIQDADTQTDRDSNQIRGLVRHNRPKRCVLPYLHPPSAQEVPKVFFRGQRIPVSGTSLRSSSLTPHIHEMRRCSSGPAQAAGHTYSELPGRLVDFSRIRTVGGSASRCRPRSYAKVGFEAQYQEECAISITEDHFSWGGMGFGHDASLSFARSCSQHPRSHFGAKARPVTHCKTVREIVGSHGSSVQCDPLWPAGHETFTVVAQDQRVLPEGKPTSYDQDHAAVSPRLGHMERTLVPVPGSGIGSSLSSGYHLDRCFPYRLGSGNGRPLSSGSVGEPSSLLAHQLPGDDGCLQSFEALPARPEGPSCAGPHRQYIGGLLHQPSGGSALAPTLQISAPDPPVVSGEITLSEGDVYTRDSEYWSRHPVEAGAEARGMEASPGGGGAHMGMLWPSRSGSVRFSVHDALSTMVLPYSSSPPGVGRYGTEVAEATSVRLSPCCSAPRSSGESPPGRSKSTSRSSTLAESNLVCGPDSSPRRFSLGDPDQERPSISGRGHYISPPARDLEALGVASEGAQLIESGLSTEVVETILSSRAPATRKLYRLKWNVFSSWCYQHQCDLVHCSVGSVLEFLQDRFASGLCPSTLKVYVAAISAFHAQVGGASLGRDPLISRFLRGTLRLRPATRSRVPAWDLAIVLEGLSRAPFEPLDSVSEKFLSFKTTFLLAISSLKRVGDLQALSVSPTCLEFAPGMVKAFLYPKQGYVPKVPTVVPRPIVLQAFCPPPFASSDQEKSNLLCPVRALDTYVHRTSSFRKSDQLFVCFGSPKIGLPATKQTLSKWIVGAILLAYESSDLPCPLGVRAHSTRSMVASRALLSGASLQDVCDAAGWSSPLTFVRFYSLDLDATPGSQVFNSRGVGFSV